MDWSSVGGWIKENAGTGAALVGSLLTGNVPGAVAAGVSLVSGATGTDDPEQALRQLQGNPDALVKLKQLYLENEADVREHIREMKRLELEDAQRSHETTQQTIRNSDNSQYAFVRNTRPGQSWVSLVAALVYVFLHTYKGTQVDIYVLGALLTLPWAYAGLRQIGKGVDSLAAVKRLGTGGGPKK